jgi:hypothetical protein
MVTGGGAHECSGDVRCSAGCRRRSCWGGSAGRTLPVIDDQSAWVLAVTGCSQAVALLAGAMVTRFMRHPIPFVRWGS